MHHITLPSYAIIESGLSLSHGPDLTRYLLVCLGMLGGIVGLAWGFRRILAQRFALHAARRSLAVIDVLPLGGRRQISVVRCYDRTFILGLGEKEVRMIAELDPVIGSERPPVPPREADAVDFKNLLERARERLGIAGRNPGRPRRASVQRLGEVVG